MSNDLERFLQQAAERLKDKIQQSQPTQRGPQTPPPISQRPPLPSAAGEVVEAKVVSSRAQGDDPLSTLDTRNALGSERLPHLRPKVAAAEERMAGHVHQVFDHQVSSLNQPSAALQGTASSSISVGSQDQTNSNIEVNRRDRMASPFVSMLRKRTTLRAAFIASEIFRRRF